MPTPSSASVTTIAVPTPPILPLPAICQHEEMGSHIARILGVAGATTCALLGAPVDIPSASADPCPDVEVVFARGTNEPAGVGGVGQAFVDSLSSQVGGPVAVYAVNYPATDDYSRSASVGADDARAQIQSIAANCPNTRMVLGGYSQGAAVIDMSTMAMPPQVADHVAAVAVFGNPSSTFSSQLAGGGPLPVIGPQYSGKTIDLCVPGDPICSAGMSMLAHVSYVQTGMTSQAATFAASRL
jgi:cutinase